MSVEHTPVPSASATIDWVFLAKGIGILLVVAGHFAIDPRLTPSYWSAAVQLVYAFHMPLFFLLSGYLYTNTNEPYFLFLRKKVERLVYPFISVALIFLPIKLFAGTEVALLHAVGADSFLYLLTNPVHSYVPLLWFVHALFFIFVLYRPAQAAIGNTAVMVLLLLLDSAARVQELPILGNALAFAPFFVAGAMLKEHQRIESIASGGNSWQVLSSMGAFIALYAVTVREGIQLDDTYLVRFGLGVLGSFAVINVAQALSNSKMDRLTMVFRDLGIYSMSIYLFHTLFESAVGTVLVGTLGIARLPFEAIAFVAIAVGLIGPLLLERFVLRKVAFTRKYLLGLK
jgi:fucose 4-O-acetylase-like acetyltransferase